MSPLPLLDVAVIGGGAAGFFAAIAFAEKNPGRSIKILEKNRRVLSKVLISGGGRCNVTNACFEPRRLVQHYPRGGKALLGPFHKFQPRDVMRWFTSRGVAMRTYPDGCVFPESNNAQTIVDCLSSAARSAGVRVKTDAAISSIRRGEPDGFVIAIKGGEDIRCRRLLLATGSGRDGYRWAGALGHAIEPLVPSLFTFIVPDPRLKGLSGIVAERAQVGIEGTSVRQSGPLLISHWGLSGPAVLLASAWGARDLSERGYASNIVVNWVGMTAGDAEDLLRRWKQDHARKTVAAHGPFDIPGRLWERLVSAAEVAADQRWADLSGARLRRLASELTAGVFAMTGKTTHKEEFVTCGGVRLDEVDFRTMESRVCPGLFFAGEVLDVDGVTGGFNLQNAWTTAWLAGRAMGNFPA